MNPQNSSKGNILIDLEQFPLYLLFFQMLTHLSPTVHLKFPFNSTLLMFYISAKIEYPERHNKSSIIQQIKFNSGRCLKIGHR